MNNILRLLAIVLGVTPLVSVGQPSGSIVVARFMIDIEGIEAEFPDNARGWLPVALEINEATDLANEAIKALKDPASSPVKIALDSVYYIIAGALRDELGMHILPLDTLRGAVPYVFGYPMGNVGKVASSEGFAGALEIDVEVTVPDANQSSWAIFSTGKVRAKGKPEMKLFVRFVETGRTVWKETVRVRSKTQISVDEYWVLGIRKRSTKPDALLLPDLTRQAATALVEKVRASGRS